MLDTKRFVRKIWQALPREPQKPETGKWSMGAGMVWLRQPEMWCPHCKVSWVNGWTWLINEKRGRVEAVWDEDSQKKYLRDIHPHVMSGGEICTGGFSVIEAITSGFNILSCFNSDEFVEIMERLGHEGCGQEDRIEEEDDRPYCESCDEGYDEGEVEWYEEASQYLCDRCWRDISVRCDNCHDRFYYPDNHSGECPLAPVRGGDEFCSSCLEDYSYCEECEEYVHDEVMQPWSAQEDPICERCWRDARKECEGCPAMVLKDDLMDGLCEECWEEREAEAEEALEDGQLELPLEAGEAADGYTNDSVM